MSGVGYYCGITYLGSYVVTKNSTFEIFVHFNSTYGAKGIGKSFSP